MTLAGTHNHLTRDVKPIGACPGCDHAHDVMAIAALPEVVDSAYELLEELALPAGAMSQSEVDRHRENLLTALRPVANRRTRGIIRGV